MSLPSYICIFSCLICGVSADSWDDFTNNLATDLAPLITLFGEQITRQCLSELVSPLDDFIFALAPLGVLTAVVSAIRMCGNSTLRALIGRAQEDPASAEKEILSCVSDSTAEIFSESGVARITGKPRILELVVDESQAHNGVIDVKRLRDFAIGLGQGKADEPDLERDVELPNLSLNKGIKRRARIWFFLAAAFGIILQSSIITYAALTVFQWPDAFLKNGTRVNSYAFPMFVLGTILLTCGMFFCAVLVEGCSKKTFYSLPEKSRVYWIQPGNQAGGDQVIPSFVARSDRGIRYVQSTRLLFLNDNASRTRTLKLSIVVCTTMIGFVVQFVGLRGLHSSVILAQLGATMVMTLVRTGLRVERMEQTDNMLKEDQSLVSNGEHEIDWLLFHILNIQSFAISFYCDSYRTNSSLQQNHIIADVLATHKHITEITGSDWDRTPIRNLAEKLTRAIYEFVKEFNSWSEAEIYVSIPVEIRNLGNAQVVSGEWCTRLKTNQNLDINSWISILSVYIWSLKSQNRGQTDGSKGKFFRTLKFNQQDIGPKKMLCQQWMGLKSFTESYDKTVLLNACQTFGMFQDGLQSIYTVIAGEIAVSVPSDMGLLASQDVFAHVLNSAFKNLTGIGGKMHLLGEGKEDFRIANDLIDKVAGIFHSSGLGTRDEALLCILPILVDHNILPEIPPTAFDISQCLGIDRNMILSWPNYGRVLEISEWLCCLADHSEVKHKLSEYVFLCLTGLTPVASGIEISAIDASAGLEAIALERLLAILEAKHDESATSFISKYLADSTSVLSKEWRKDFQKQTYQLTLCLLHLDYGYTKSQRLNQARGKISSSFSVESPADQDISLLSEEILSRLWLFSADNPNVPPGISDIQPAYDFLVQKKYETIIEIWTMGLTSIYWSRMDSGAFTNLLRFAVNKNYDNIVFQTSRFVEGIKRLWSVTSEELGIEGNVQALQALTSQFGPRTKREAYEIAFLEASDHKQTSLLESLLLWGVDVNIQDLSGDTALMRAAVKNDVESVKLLLDHNADLNIRNISKSTALIRAAKNGRIDCVKILVEKGADLDAVDSMGRTALMAAVRKTSLETLQILIDNGADLNIKDNLSYTALDIAGVEDYDNRMAEVRALLKKAMKRQHGD